MRLKLILGALLILTAPMMRAQFLPSPPGISCTQGATQSITTGLSSTGYQLSEFPSCAVTVYNRGTITLSTIYTNSTGTPLSNPFQAPTNGLPAFYAAAGHYDVTVSQAGMITTTFPDVNLTTSGSGTSGVISINTVPGAFTFTGAVSCTGTSCNFTGGAPTIEVNGTPITDQTHPNFVNGGGVTWTNPSAGIINAAASGGGVRNAGNAAIFHPIQQPPRHVCG